MKNEIVFGEMTRLELIERLTEKALELNVSEYYGAASVREQSFNILMLITLVSTRSLQDILDNKNKIDKILRS